MEPIGKAAVVVLAVAVMSGCSSTNSKEEKWLSFHCPDGRTVLAQFEPKDEFVNVQFEGRELRLTKTISASGARYSDGKTTFWNRGRSALIEIDTMSPGGIRHSRMLLARIQGVFGLALDQNTRWRQLETVTQKFLIPVSMLAERFNYAVG